MKSLTAKSVTAIIAANKSTFCENATFTEVKLRNLFAITKPTLNPSDSFTVIARKANNYQLNKASAYTALNRVLSNYGLCIAQEKGNRYRVLANEDAIAKAGQATTRSLSCMSKATRLSFSVPRFQGFTPARRFNAL